MKKFYTILAALLIAAVPVFACADVEPGGGGSGGGGGLEDNGGGGGSGGGGEFHPKDTHSTLYFEDGTTIDLDIYGDGVDLLNHKFIVSFPVTINLAFSGFTDSVTQAQEPITRMCLLYQDQNKKWHILYDVQNPPFKVVLEADDTRPLFGRYTIPDSFGYSTEQYLPIKFYFKSERQQSFDLENLLNGGYPGARFQTDLMLKDSGNQSPW